MSAVRRPPCSLSFPAFIAFLHLNTSFASLDGDETEMFLSAISMLHIFPGPEYAGFHGPPPEKGPVRSLVAEAVYFPEHKNLPVVREAAPGPPTVAKALVPSLFPGYGGRGFPFPYLHVVANVCNETVCRRFRLLRNLCICWWRACRAKRETCCPCETC